MHCCEEIIIYILFIQALKTPFSQNTNTTISVSLSYVWYLACSLSRHGHPDSKLHGAIMGSTLVLLAPDGPHAGPMNLAIGPLTIVDLSSIEPEKKHVRWVQSIFD